MRIQGTIDFTVTEQSPERVVAVMPIQAGIKNPFGVVRAGALLWFADVAARVLVMGALLLAAATRDTIDEDVPMHEQLAEVIAATGVPFPPLFTFDDDHSFSASREELARALIAWLDTDYAATQQSKAAK